MNARQFISVSKSTCYTERRSVRPASTTLAVRSLVGMHQMADYYLQQAVNGDLPAAATRGPRCARLLSEVRAERPVAIREGHTTRWQH